MTKIDIFSELLEKRILFLSGEIDFSLATELTAKLLYLDIKSNEDITMYINSIGGSVSDGLLTIYDVMQKLKSDIKTINIGEAYSSAAIILSAGTKGKRFAFPNSTVMIHSIQIEEVAGTQKEVQDEARRIKKLNKSLMDIIAKHSGQNIKKIKRDCLKDKYLTPEEAIKYGLIDGII